MYIATLVVVAVIGQDPANEKMPQEKQPAKDLERLQGDWKRVQVEERGKLYEPINDANEIFEKNTILSMMAGKVAGRFTFKIDPSKNPKTIDITCVENKLIPESKGTVIRCIYKFDEKGRLYIRSPPSGFGIFRPTEFATKDSNWSGTLEIYERERKKANAK